MNKQIQSFLPQQARIIEIEPNQPAIVQVDVDGDQEKEWLVAYEEQGKEYLLVIKEQHPFYFRKCNGQYEWFHRDQVVLDVKQGDITGDGNADTIYLIGTKQEGSAHVQNITLVVRYYNQSVETIPLKEGSGYKPTIFLGDMTGEQINDVLIVIDSGGSGGTVYAYIYSFQQGNMKLLFDSDVFNKNYQYKVQYQDQYTVRVESAVLKKRYTLSLKDKELAYLSAIYRSDGTLRQPIQGFVSPLAGIYPIDLERDGTYELVTFQNIAGQYNADRLGYVNNVLRWNGQNFVPLRQTIEIFGRNIS
ncbi:hypothetical protein [Bacillus sp. REN10]|uniref:hypothetical protein n=1 Tax=Bacillus sp. REN10 TaxID=2782541 RepID=UPI00193C501D|nr:hypothetical protein [Bacillus sp. REN10]